MLLAEAGVRAVNCRDIEAMCGRIGEDTLFAVVTEEALLEADIGPLGRFVRDQPAWSSLPFVILTRRGGGPEQNPEAARLSEVLQNVTFIERPFHGTTFVSVARSARRSRLRQYEGRASEETLRASEAALKELNESLEQRVAERTAELEKAHALVLAEIAQREQAEEILRQAQKMEVLGRFTGGVAHDFNNLLMAVISNLELLSKHLSNDERAGRLISGAMQGAQRGASLTQRLLAFARRQELTLEAREMCELVRASEQLLQHSIGDQHTLELDLPHFVPPALMDHNQFELALLNLVINARDATPDGGAIRIAVDHVVGGAAGGHGTDFVRLRVEDKGHGMDERTLEQATQPFFSTKELGKGTGLGLSMIHGLAVQLNGKLVLSSEPGVGTTAEFWLPVSAERVSLSLERQSTTPPSSTQDERPLRILFVDDDALIAMSSVEMLQDLGHHVTETFSGAEALAALEGDGHFDLMITDFSMPRMNGAELSKAARRLRPALPILLATGFAELPDGQELDLPRLPKPYGQQQLRDEIRKLLV